MSEDKKRDRALQRRVRERQEKTGESYQAAWRQLTDQADQPDPEFTRYSTGLYPLDSVLGGGLVSDSVVLLTGPTGSGRALLTLQLLKGLGHRCLYVSPEGVDDGDVSSDQIRVTSERSLTKILARAREPVAKTIAINTIHSIFCEDVNGRAGSTEQLDECVNRLIDYAKTTGTVLWLIGDAEIPTTIEHSVDVVLDIERGAYFEGRERIVSCAGKNRFGPTNAVGCFELTAKGFIPVDGNKTPAVPSRQSSADSALRRIPLPLSSVVNVLPGQSAQITARPQVESFWPDRLLIKNADHWEIHRLAVGGGKSPWLPSLIEEGPRRASVFSLDTWHPLTKHEVTCGEDIVMVMTYTGPNEQGERLEASLFGWVGCLPATSDRHEADTSKRVSERAESKSVQAGEMVALPITVASPTLFVDRFTIADAEDWIVHDIRTHGTSILLQNGDLPGGLFSGSAPVILKPLAADDRVEIAATYVGNKTTACLVVELSGTAKPPSVRRAVSYFLPMSTDVPILPTQSAQITGRPRREFLLERMVIADPNDWIVNDIRIGNRCQPAQSGDLPGQAFSSRTVGCDMTLDPVYRGQDFVIVTTRGEGGKEEGAGFYCGVQGRLVQEP